MTDNTENLDINESPMEPTAQVTDHRTKPVERRAEHTTKNTTVKNDVEPKWDVMPKDPNDFGSIPVFLGTLKENFHRHVQMMKLWMEANAAEEMVRQEKMTEAVAQPRIKEYQEYREAEFGDLDDAAFKKTMQDFLSFNQDSVEQSFYRHERNMSPNWRNVTEFANDFMETDVMGRLPQASKNNLSMAMQMVRGSSRSSKDPAGYDILVRDSFVQLRLSRSDLLEIGDLIDNVNRQIVGYTRRLNGNSLTLARVAMYRVFWDHLIAKVSEHTVKGIDDLRELGKVIKFNNLNDIFVSFIHEIGRTGVPFTLYCTSPKCHWNDTQNIEGAILKWFDPTLLTDGQAAALGNLRNGVRKYSYEDIVKLRKESKWVEDNRIYFDNRNQYLVIDPASVNEAFACYDVFMEFMNPRIESLRDMYVSDAKYEEELASLMETYRTMEYIHWVSELHIIEEDGTETVYTRAKDPIEFFKGLIDIVNRQSNINLGKDLIEFIQRRGPEFSSTVVGVPNFACPKCGKNSGEDSSIHGITPVDPFTCFFILSRLEIGKRQIQMAAADAAL